jgi:hypothetical protein
MEESTTWKKRLLEYLEILTISKIPKCFISTLDGSLK